MNAYGSKEDDASALKSLSQIQLSEDQTRESFANEIVKSLGSSNEVNLLELIFCSLMIILNIHIYLF